MKLPDELIFLRNARLPQRKTEARLDGRLCVLTGATSGVGYEAAKCLAQRGATLVLVCRNRDKAGSLAQELANGFGTETSVIIADFKDLDQVREAARAILVDHDQIHLLINNVGMHSTRRTLTADGAETVFSVNHLAPFLLTRLLLDRIRASAPARVIQVNSEGHRFGGLRLDDINWEHRPYNGLFSYGASKVAQLHTIRVMAEKLEGSGVTINAIHPGAVRTNIGMDNGPVYRWYRRNVLNRFLKSPGISGEAIAYLASSPELIDVTGKYFNLTHEEPPASYVMNPALTPQVWQLSEQLTGLATAEPELMT